MKVHSILIFAVLLSTAIGAPQWEDLTKRLAEMDKDEIDDISTEDWEDKLKDVLKQEYKELKDELSSDEWDDQKDEVKDTLKKKYKTYKKEIKKQIKEAKKLKSAEESSEESESLEKKVKKESRRRKQERRNEKEAEKAKRIKTHTRKGTLQEKEDEEKLIPQTDDTVEQPGTQVEQNSPAISHLIQKTNKAFEKFRKFVLEAESNSSSGRINSNPLLAYIANKKLHSGSHAHSRRPILPPTFEFPFRRPASEANESVGLPVPSTVSGGEIGIGSGTAENGAASLSKINEAASIVPGSQPSGTDVNEVSTGSSDVNNVVSSSGSSVASAGGDFINSGTSSELIIQDSVSHRINGSASTGQTDLSTSSGTGGTLSSSSNVSSTSGISASGDTGSDISFGSSTSSVASSQVNASTIDPSLSVISAVIPPIASILPALPGLNVGTTSGNAATAESSSDSVGTANVDASSPDSSPPASAAVIPQISSNLPAPSGSSGNANSGSAVVAEPSIGSAINSHSDANTPGSSPSAGGDTTSPIFTILPFPLLPNVSVNSGNAAVAESSTGSAATSNADANTPDSSPITSAAGISPIFSNLPASSGSNVNANPGSAVVDGPSIDSGKNSHSDANAPSPSSSVSDDKTSPTFTILPFPFPSNVGAISENTAIAGLSTGGDANNDVNTPDSSSSINTAVIPPSDGTLPDAPESSGDIISESAVISGSSSVDITAGSSSEPESIASIVTGNTKPSEPAIDPIATSESGVSVSSDHANVAAFDNTIAADDTRISESSSLSKPAEGVHIGVITPSEPATDPNTISESGVSASSNQSDASASDTIETDLNGSSISSSKSNAVTSGSKPDATGTSNSKLNPSSLIDTLVSGPESSVSADHSSTTSSGSPTDSGSGSGPVSEIESGAEPALETDVENIPESTVKKTLILPNIPPLAVESEIQSDSSQASTPHLSIPDTPSLPNTNFDSTVGESSSPVDILPSNAGLDLPAKDIPSSNLKTGVSPIKGYLPWQEPLTDSESGTTIEVTSSDPVSGPETTSASSDPSVPTDASPPINGTDASSTDASEYTTTESTIDKSTTDGSNHTITEPTTDKSTTDGSDSTTIEPTTDGSDYTTTESTTDKSTTDGSDSTTIESTTDESTPDGSDSTTIEPTTDESDYTTTESTTDKSTTDGSNHTITEPTIDKSTTDGSDSTTIEPTTNESTTDANDIPNNSTIIIGKPASPDSSPNENSPTTGSQYPLGGIDTWIPYSFPQRYKRQSRYPLRARRFYLI